MKNLIKQLVKESYTNDELDEKKVEMIASKLQRPGLKMYLKELQRKEQKKHVIITTAKQLSVQEEEKVGKLFPQKKVLFQTDETLISGIRVLDNDIIYEKNISQALNDMSLYITNI